MEAKRLGPKDYSELLTKLRALPDHTRNIIAPLVLFTQYLLERNKSLQEEVSRLKQLSLEEQLKEPIKPYKPAQADVWAGQTLKQRITEYRDNGELDTDDFRRLLKYNQLSMEQAMEIIK